MNKTEVLIWRRPTWPRVVDYFLAGAFLAVTGLALVA